ncbi:hypothetical protein ABIA45_001782 [Bradyrhizobium sp. USDA 336]
MYFALLRSVATRGRPARVTENRSMNSCTGSLTSFRGSQLAKDVLGSFPSPAIGRVEGDDAHGMIVLAEGGTVRPVEAVSRHAGRGGNARGTSKREDVLDTIIQLKHPERLRSRQRGNFEAHVTKARGVFGEDALAFEAKLELTKTEGPAASVPISRAKTQRTCRRCWSCRKRVRARPARLGYDPEQPRQSARNAGRARERHRPT